MANTYITPGFLQLKVNARSYFLDTNVWSSLATSPVALQKFLPWLRANDVIAALSMFTVMELSRASRLHEKFDDLLESAAERIYVPLLYDELSDLEMDNYPNEVELLWNHLENFRVPDGIRFISKISKDLSFQQKRQEYLDFGYDKFMNLEQMKKNFPFEDESGNYSFEYANKFAWATSLDFLVRHFPKYLMPFKGNLRSYDPSILKSLYFRSKFLYYKFYVHRHSPNESDFLDFAHVSYLPYVNGFVTERNVFNVLSHMKKNGDGLPQCELIHISKFLEDVENLNV